MVWKMSENGKEPLIEVRDVKVYFYLDEGTVHAVEGVSFDIERGKTLGVVGESGCGKSVTSQAIMQIVPPPGKIVAGDIFFYRYNDDGSSEKIEITKLDPRGSDIRNIRGNEIAKIFQEPMTSLSPMYTIGNQIVETIRLHTPVSKQEARQQAIAMLDKVGIHKPDRLVDEYPFRLSGGMRQRAMIAMALSCNPNMLIADEPSTALDVTTQAQILDIMQDLQKQYNMALLFITHDLGVVAEIADDVAVMYLGKIIECANVDTVFNNPKHPYTQALLRSIPKIAMKREELDPIKGMVPNPYRRPSGCPFHPRCSKAMEVCKRIVPSTTKLSDTHAVQCLLYEDLSGKTTAEQEK
jgi:oligopeptide/dipeptide ABC transporter ATP-binding protein